MDELCNSLLFRINADLNLAAFLLVIRFGSSKYGITMVQVAGVAIYHISRGYARLYTL